MDDSIRSYLVWHKSCTAAKSLIKGLISTLFSYVALLSNTDEMWSIATMSSTELFKWVGFLSFLLPTWFPVLLDLNRNASHIHIVNTSLDQRSMQLQENWDETCFIFWSWWKYISKIWNCHWTGFDWHILRPTYVKQKAGQNLTRQSTQFKVNLHQIASLRVASSRLFCFS